jgi:hypothetical protein
MSPTTRKIGELRGNIDSNDGHRDITVVLSENEAIPPHFYISGELTSIPNSIAEIEHLTARGTFEWDRSWDSEEWFNLQWSKHRH